MFESNVELNSDKPKHLHQTNNKSGIVGQWLFKTKSKWRHLSRNCVWFDSKRSGLTQVEVGFQALFTAGQARRTPHDQPIQIKSLVQTPNFT